jgi:hypothetical protein
MTGTWLRQTPIIDQDLRARFQGRDGCSQNLHALLILPVMEDPAVKIHIRILHNLGREEVIFLELDVGAFVLGFHVFGHIDILDNEFE